jgi:hypothetical protein
MSGKLSDENAKKANQLSFWSLVVAGLLFIATVIIAWQSSIADSKAIGIAQNASDFAQQANNIASKALNTTLPHFSFQSNLIYNNSTNADISDVGIIYKSEGQELDSFTAFPNQFINMTVYNESNKYSLLIPVENYYSKPVWANSPLEGVIGNFTPNNLKESNIVEFNAIEKNFSIFAGTEGYENELDFFSYAHLIYTTEETETSIDQYRYLGGTPDPYNPLNEWDTVGSMPKTENFIDFSKNDLNNTTQYNEWIKEAQLNH